MKMDELKVGLYIGESNPARVMVRDNEHVAIDYVEGGLDVIDIGNAIEWGPTPTWRLDQLEVPDSARLPEQRETKLERPIWVREKWRIGGEVYFYRSEGDRIFYWVSDASGWEISAVYSATSIEFEDLPLVDAQAVAAGDLDIDIIPEPLRAEVKRLRQSPPAPPQSEGKMPSTLTINGELYVRAVTTTGTIVSAVIDDRDTSIALPKWHEVNDVNKPVTQPLGADGRESGK